MRYLQVPRYLLPDFFGRLERLQELQSTDATLIDTTPITTEEHLYLPVSEPPEPLPSTAFLLGRRSLPIAALLCHPQVDLSLRLFLSRHGRRHGALFDANNPDTQADTVHLLESFVRAIEDVEGDSVCRAALAGWAGFWRAFCLWELSCSSRTALRLVALDVFYRAHEALE